MKSISLRTLDILAAALAVAGGLNWGAIAISGVDLTSSLSGLDFGQLGEQNRLVYGAVGLGALYQVVALPSLWQRWGIVGEPAAPTPQY